MLKNKEMNFMITDNPAARLLAILKNAHTLNGDARAKDCWLRIFELKGSDLNTSSILMSKLGQVMLLPHEIRVLVDQFYPNHASSLDHTLSQIQKAFIAQNLSGNWNTFSQHIDVHCINGLSMVSAMLDVKLDSKLIEKEVLTEFYSKVQELSDEVLSADLPSEFKKFMSHYLWKILNAIGDYLISGAMPILASVEATLGHAVLDPDFRSILNADGVGKKIREVLAALADTATVATAAAGAVAYIASNGFPMLT